MDDPIVNEVHEIRRRIFEECGCDLDRYIEHIKAAEEQDKDRLVTFEEVQQRAADTAKRLHSKAQGRGAHPG